MKKRAVKYKYILIAFSFLIYIISVYIYTTNTLTIKKEEAIAAVDERLKLGAYAVYELLGEEFFKHAIKRDSITPEEDWKNIRKLTSFTKQAGLAFLYSVVLKDKKIYVIASSATQEELNNGTELHYYHLYDTASNELASTFKDHTIRIVDYKDEWGEFRGIFIPIKISNDQTAVMASEVELSYLNDVLNNVKKHAYIDGGLFLIFLTPLVLSIGYLLKLENIELHELLHTDNLTSLPNRLFLITYLNKYISNTDQNIENLALLHIDIDNFKEINDGFGYRVGDDALISIANRLNEHILDRGILTRHEGDDFFLVIRYTNQTSVVSDTAQYFIDLFENPISTNAYQFYITCSIGISLFPLHAKSTSELIQNAHMATSKVKENGKNSYLIFNSEINNTYNKMFELRQNIKTAINNNEYYLVYQPQYNAITGAVVGLEALLRWQHPTRGSLSPNEFIPYAENSGLIIEIEKIVLTKAISKGAEWETSGYLPNIRIAINISPQLLYQDFFIQSVRDLLTKYGCSPSILKFEITEQAAIKYQDISIAKLHEIRRLGIEISIDDFGSGYSSLAYLKDLPADQIKIDRSFVVNVAEEQRNQAIIKSIIQLCSGLGLSVIAEGAETKEEVDFLVEAGCEYIQGYYFSKPVDNERCISLLHSASTQQHKHQPGHKNDFHL
ncbi:MAG: bifunctional diguanylate cyclase/phosphodiesterase [Candidatus Thiodiazotropha sp.]